MPTSIGALVSNCETRTGVRFAHLDVFPIPLTNARAASISEDNPTNTLESFDLTITCNSSANLFRTRGNCEFALEIDTVLSSLFDDGRRARHILIR